MPRYKTYYGRKKFRWLKMLILSLLAGGFVALCVFILPNYVTYSEDGLTFDLPLLKWMVRKSPSPAPPAHTGGVVEVPPLPTPTPSMAPPSPSSAPYQKPKPTRALFLPSALLGNPAELETMRDRALGEGFTILALEYKDIKGIVVNDATLKTAMETLARPDLTLMAVIPACVDSTIPFGPNSGWAVKHTSGVNFKDHLDRRWLNLYLPEVRGFIAEQILNAYDAGFDRVLLTHVGFPYSGGAGQTDYNGLDITIGHVTAVNTLLQDLRDTIGDRPLDVLLFEDEGVLEEAGQDMAVFTGTFDLMFTGLSDDGILEMDIAMGELYESSPWD